MGKSGKRFLNDTERVFNFNDYQNIKLSKYTDICIGFCGKLIGVSI
jgi:hypothetical protein